MKILFTADWHIKLGQKKVPKAWQKGRYYKLFSELHELENRVDLVILGGDIFDKIPNIEELELFFDYISGIKKKTIIYDGNHEATRKRHSFLHNLSNIITSCNPKVTIINKITSIENIDIIPYTDIHTFDSSKLHGDILCTHVRGEIKPHVFPEIDLDKLDKWKLVLAGDLHSHSNSQRNILYPGSPLTISFHRNKVETGVLIVDTESLEHEWVNLHIPQLLRKTVSSLEDVKATKYDHTIYELETKAEEVISIPDSTLDIIDKKITQNNVEAKLNLHNLSIAEEVDMYLSKVLNIEDTANILKVLYDYNKEIDMG